MSVKTYNAYFIVLLLGFFFASCAHNRTSGIITSKESDQVARIPLGYETVKVGDKINIYRYACEQPKSPRDNAPKACSKGELEGEGEVTEVLGKHSSMMKVVGGHRIRGDEYVEKQE